MVGDYRGSKVGETEGMNVPTLARHLMTVLPERTGLVCSATVYRYRRDAPWIVEVNVSGLPADDVNDERAIAEHVHYVESEIEEYNYTLHGRYRFVSHVVVLRAFERHHPQPGRVVVRRLHLRPRLFPRLARLRVFLAGCLL